MYIAALERMDDGTGLPQGLAAYAPVAAPVAATTGPPGLALLAPPAVVLPAAVAALKEALPILVSFISELIDAAVSQHFDFVRAATALQGEELVDLHPKMGWPSWQALAVSRKGPPIHPTLGCGWASIRSRAPPPRCACWRRGGGSPTSCWRQRRTRLGRMTAGGP